MRLLALTVTLLAVAPLGAAAQAQPPRHGMDRHAVAHRDAPRHRFHRNKVCRTVWSHHHKVRRCR